MDDNKNPFKKRLSEQLPSHSPDPGSWQRLSAKLDAMDADAAFYEKLEQLPTHSPDLGTWAAISSRLSRVAYLKTAARIALTAAAGLLLFFTVARISESYQHSNAVPAIARMEKPGDRPAFVKPTVTLTPAVTESQSPVLHSTVSFSNEKTGNPTQVIEQSISANGSGKIISEITAPVVSEATDIVPLKPEMAAENVTGSAEQNSATNETPASTVNILKSDSQTTFATLPAIQENTTAPTAKKYYTPDDPKVSGQKNNFALAMNYLPENIYNGSGNSLFHNVDLTASYNKEKVRFNTSLGLAYNEEQLEFDMNYDIKTPITATGSGGHLDTLGYNVSNMESQYQGTEKHQYLTYNLGIERRLFRLGKFSSWFSAGAGFGVRLNNPDLISATEKNIKGQFNAMITSVNTPSKPVYNDVNINFVTGVVFNYEIYKRLSFTFTPTSRWYFKPVLTKDNQATDELTLGFRTGLKLGF